MEYFVHILIGDFRLVTQFGFWHVFNKPDQILLKIKLHVPIAIHKVGFFFFLPVCFSRRPQPNDA